MERRTSNRIIVVLEAEIISGINPYSGFSEISTGFPGVNFYTYAGIIENLSEDGMLITIPGKSNLNLNIGSELEIGFQLPSGERLDLHCMVKRFHDKTSAHGVSHGIGMVIIDPPRVYCKFLKDGRIQI